MIKVVERIPLKRGKGGLERNSEFTIYFPDFRGDEWKWLIPVGTYLAYKSKPRERNNVDEENYWKFVTPEDAHIYEITEEIGRECLGSAWRTQKKDFTDLVIDFVGHIPYHEKNENFCYVKYPIEMLCEFGGNCADASVLAASMLAIGGIESCFIHFEEHVVLGVDVPAEGKYIIRGDKKFYITDATGSDWPNEYVTPKIGFLNEEYDPTKAEKIDFRP